MSIKIMAQVWEFGPSDKTETLVMLALADFCNDAGECWPSMERIAEKARLSDARSARRIVRRLEDAGWLDVVTGKGRSGCNQYRIKPGPSVLENPDPVSPDPQSPPDPERIKPGPSLPKTRTPEPPEPSRTVIEPSVSNDAREIRSVLCKWASPESVTSFIAYRRKQKGKALSLTAAKRLAGHLERIFQEGGDPDDALGLAEERGWQSVEADWYFKAKGQANENGYDNRTGNRGAAQRSENRPDAALEQIARLAGLGQA